MAVKQPNLDVGSKQSFTIMQTKDLLLRNADFFVRAVAVVSNTFVLLSARCGNANAL